MIIGISGKSGCGKTTFAKRLISESKKDCVHLDIDKVGHTVLTIPEVQEELIHTFGDVVEDGVVNRKKLGAIVFSSPDEMNKLTNITWKYMQIEIDEFIQNNEGKVIILDWLLLPITKYFEICNIKVLLDIPYEVRKKRAMKRDSITEEAFDLRDQASIDLNSGDFDIVVQKDEDFKRMVKLL